MARRISGRFLTLLFKRHTEKKKCGFSLPCSSTSLCWRKGVQAVRSPPAEARFSELLPCLCGICKKRPCACQYCSPKVTEELLKLASLGLFSASTGGCRSCGKRREHLSLESYSQNSQVERLSPDVSFFPMEKFARSLSRSSSFRPCAAL